MEAVREKSFVWQKFYEAKRKGAMNEDWGESEVTSPLVPTAEWIKTETEAHSMFAPMWIRYHRGACMMAMLRSMLGDEVLLSSIKAYLTSYSYSTVVTRNLFEFLDKPAKKLGAVPVDSHIRDFMEPWVNRSGYPVMYLARNMTSNTVWNMAMIKHLNVLGSGDSGEIFLGERKWNWGCQTLVRPLKLFCISI